MHAVWVPDFMMRMQLQRITRPARTRDFFIVSSLLISGSFCLKFYQLIIHMLFLLQNQLRSIHRRFMNDQLENMCNY